MPRSAAQSAEVKEGASITGDWGRVPHEPRSAVHDAEIGENELMKRGIHLLAEALDPLI